MMMIKRILLTILSSLLLVACYDTDDRLCYISANLSVCLNPMDALASLDSIDRSALDDYNSGLYDFLTIKAADKAYITHKSDTLIKRVIDWAQKSNRNLLPEALYYGGRVYADMGDLPTAIRYLNDAANILPANADTTLRINIVSQTGRLLSNLHLNEQAMPYLKESIRLATQINDSLLAFDYELLSSNFVDMHEYDSAEAYLAKAVEIAKSMSDEDQAIMQGKMAVLKYELGQYDSALALMQGVPQRISPMHRDYFTACAADIYFKSENYDSAYLYSKSIINSEEISYRITGYRWLLAPELSNFTSQDTLRLFHDKYTRELVSRYNEHDAQSVIIQNSLYNYSLHERESKRLSLANMSLRSSLLVVVVVVLILIIIVLWQRNSIIKKRLSLRRSLEIIEILSKQKPVSAVSTESSESVLRKSIEEKLKQIDMTDKTPSLPESLLRSDAYISIAKHVEDNAAIPLKSPLWENARQIINYSFPDFLVNLQAMAVVKLDKNDELLAMLMKMQFSPKSVSILMAKTSGTITYRRKILLKKLVPYTQDVSRLDVLIRLL